MLQRLQYFIFCNSQLPEVVRDQLNGP